MMESASGSGGGASASASLKRWTKGPAPGLSNSNRNLLCRPNPDTSETEPQGVDEEEDGNEEPPGALTVADVFRFGVALEGRVDQLQAGTTVPVAGR